MLRLLPADHPRPSRSVPIAHPGCWVQRPFATCHLASALSRVDQKHQADCQSTMRLPEAAALAIASRKVRSAPDVARGRLAQPSVTSADAVPGWSGRPFDRCDRVGMLLSVHMHQPLPTNRVGCQPTCRTKRDMMLSLLDVLLFDATYSRPGNIGIIGGASTLPRRRLAVIIRRCPSPPRRDGHRRCHSDCSPANRGTIALLAAHRLAGAANARCERTFWCPGKRLARP